MAKTEFNPSGTIKSAPYSDFFNSPSYRKLKAKALAYDPLKSKKHVAKAPNAPSSPNQGEAANKRLARKATFFVDQAKPKKLVAAHATPAKPEAKAKAAPKPKKATNPDLGKVYADFFKSPSFAKARRKALSYDPLKGAKHVARAPQVSPEYAALLRPKAKTKPAKLPKAEPSLTASYVSRPGHTPQFEMARVVKDQAQLSALIGKGDLDLLSAIAYMDTRGRVHTGSVLEIYSMLPGKNRKG